MKTIKKIIIAIMVFISLLIQTGCWDQKIFERIGFILQLGLELDKEGKLLYTVSIPVVELDSEAKVEIFTASKSLLRESREEVRHVAGKAVEGGKTQHIYFSEQLAQKGISQYLEVFLRNTENPLLSNVIVVDGSPNKMLELSAKFKNKPRPAFYVNELLVNARQNSYVPETRIYDIYTMKYSKTIDPVTPIFRYNEKQIEIAGSALFKGDKMVGKIDTSETGMLYALSGEDRKTQFMYHGNNEGQESKEIKEGAAILIKGTKRKVDVDVEGKEPKINFKLDFKASLDEYDKSHNMDDPEAKKKLEDKVALSIKKDCLKLLKYLQEVGSDPIGIGEMIRSKHNEYWKSIRWEDVYKEASFEVDVNLIFEFYGAVN